MDNGVTIYLSSTPHPHPPGFLVLYWFQTLAKIHFIQVCLDQSGSQHTEAFGVTKLGKVFHWNCAKSSLAPPTKIKILHQLVSIRYKS